MNWRLIKAADEFKDKTHSHQPVLADGLHTHQNDSGRRDPKTAFKRFHPGLCPSQRGQPRGPGHAIEACFESCFLERYPADRQGGRSRNAKRPGALIGRSGGKCGLSLRCHPVKEAMLTAMAPRSEHSRRCPPRSWSLTCSQPVRTKRQDTRGSRDLRRAADNIAGTAALSARSIPVNALGVSFQEVVHSVLSEEAEVAEASDFRGRTEWTLTRMRL